MSVCMCIHLYIYIHTNNIYLHNLLTENIIKSPKILCSMYLNYSQISIEKNLCNILR